MVERVQYRVDDKVGIITLDRPDSLNALTRQMISDLRDHLLAVESAGDVRVLMLTGTGRAFSAGIDLGETGSDLENDEQAAEENLEVIQEITRVLMRLPIPTVAAMNGLAVGMGSEICIACDIRVAAESSYLWFSEARRGLFQSNGVMYLLPRLIGHSRSIEWMMSARKIQSDELRASGLVAAIYPDEDFPREALEYARRVAVNSPLSLRLQKSVGQAAFASSYEEVLALEVAGMRETMHSEYIREGLKAFAEKRDPKF